MLKTQLTKTYTVQVKCSNALTKYGKDTVAALLKSLKNGLIRNIQILGNFARAYVKMVCCFARNSKSNTPIASFLNAVIFVWQMWGKFWKIYRQKIFAIEEQTFWNSPCKVLVSFAIWFSIVFWNDWINYFSVEGDDGCLVCLSIKGRIELFKNNYYGCWDQELFNMMTSHVHMWSPLQ